MLPVLVTGSMAHPLFAPDVQAMTKMKLSNLLPTSGDPSKGTIGGILGGVLGGGQQQQQKGQPQQQQQQQNPLNSIFDQLKKKK